MSAPYDAATIANRFIELAEQVGKKLTPMQLIKLSYIAHGFSLAIFRRPLLAESVEAWRYGPVIPSLYRRLKKYGSNDVSGPITQMFSSFSGDGLEQDDASLIEAVYKKYGSLNGIQLSHLTHRKGTPWDITYRPDEYGSEIDNDVIESHYAAMLSK